jgi:hypothetical protein
MDTPYTADTFAPPAGLRRLQTPFLAAGVAGLVIAGLGYMVDRPHFFQGWLVAWLLWLSIALGCLGLSMLHHLTRGAWGLMIRRPLEAGARTLPLLLVLFLPVAFGMHDLFSWSLSGHAAAATVGAEPVPNAQGGEGMQASATYLNVPFFLGRAAAYFVIWIGFAFVLSRLSRRQDETGDPALFGRMQAISAVGFLTLAVTGSFAAIDWMMSIDPKWSSSLYGLWFFAGLGLSGLTFAVVVANWLGQREPMAEVLRAPHLHHKSNHLLANTNLWG